MIEHRPLSATPRRPCLLRPACLALYARGPGLHGDTVRPGGGRHGGESPGSSQRRRSDSTATSGRSSPTSASSATVPTPTQRKAQAAARQPRRPRPARRRRGARRSSRASSTRASSSGGSPPTTPTSGCRRPRRGKPLTPAEVEQLKTWIEQGAEYRGTLGVHPARSGPSCPTVKNPGWVRNPIDAFVLARLEKRGARALARGRPGHAAAPAQPRPDRPAADDRGGRRVPGRHQRRTPTSKQVERLLRLAALRRALGPASGSTPPATPTPTATRRTSRARSGSIATGSINALNRDLPYDQFVIEQIAGDLLPNADAGPDRRHRLPAQLDDQRGRRHRSRAVPHGGDVRPHGRHRQGRARPDDPVRPVPHPQVRPAHAGGVLPAVRLPEQRPRGATSRSTRPTSR